MGQPTLGSHDHGDRSVSRQLADGYLTSTASAIFIAKAGMGSA